MPVLKAFGSIFAVAIELAILMIRVFARVVFEPSTAINLTDVCSVEFSVLPTKTPLLFATVLPTVAVPVT